MLPRQRGEAAGAVSLARPRQLHGPEKLFRRDQDLQPPPPSTLPPECGVTAATTLRYSMPVAAVVHTITSLACRPSVCERSPSPMTRFQREISHSTRARQLYPDACCQPMRPRSAIHRRCRSRCVGAVRAVSLGTELARGGTTTAAAGGGAVTSA